MKKITHAQNKKPTAATRPNRLAPALKVPTKEKIIETNERRRNVMVQLVIAERS